MRYFLVGFVFYFSFISYAATTTKPTTEALWKASDDLSGLTEQFINSYKKKLKANDPQLEALQKPEILARIKEGFKKKWSLDVEAEFSEQEVIYLAKLYSHPLMKKAYEFDGKFWVPGLNSVILQELSSATVTPTKTK